MSTTTRLAAVVIFCAAVDGMAQSGATFSLPGSVLLFGDYNELHVATPTRTQIVHPSVAEEYNRGYFAYPTLAPAADSIAWGHAIGWDENRRKNRARFRIGLYALAKRNWITYGDFDLIGTAAYSPSGSTVVFVARRNEQQELLILKTRTGDLTRVRTPVGGVREKASIGWSPDETRLVVEVQRGGVRYTPHMAKADAERPSVVAVLDLKDGTTKVLAEGFDPTWSPSGEWIAYYSDDRCVLVHPDGTGSRLAFRVTDSWFTSKDFGVGGPVWSPDSKKLLLNVVKDGGPLVDVLLLDLATGRTITKATSGLPVFGWATYRP